MVDPLGLERGVVRLVEYDARWPALFDAEGRRIRVRCGTLPVSMRRSRDETSEANGVMMEVSSNLRKRAAGERSGRRTPAFAGREGWEP
jgi:hypothetical protein